MTASSDIYSLGAVGYFLLTGNAPFGGRSAMQMLAAHLYEKPQRLNERRTDVPSALADVIERCLEKAPEQRFLDMETLERALVGSVPMDSWTDSDARD